MSDAYGELTTHSDPPITLNLPVAGTFVKWPNFNAGLGGPTDLIQIDAPNDQFVVGANGAGIYRSILTASFSGDPNTLVHGSVFLNGVRQTKLEFCREMGGAGDTGSAAGNGFVILAVGDILDVRFVADVNNKDVDIWHLGFTLHAVLRDL